MERLKVITSYAANTRWFEETAEEPLGEIPRQDISSPYMYSPSHTVYSWEGKAVINVETSHRRYEIYDIGDIEILIHG